MKLANLMLNCKVPGFARETIFGASVVAFKKPEGGVWPMPVGSVYRRLTGRFVARQATSRLAEHLSPFQVRLGVEQGYEANVHALREYVM